MVTTVVPANTTVTTTGPLTAVDTSQISGDFTVNLLVTALSANLGQSGARIVIEETTNSTWYPVIVADVQGPISGNRLMTFRRYQLLLSPIGSTGSEWRANIVYLAPGSPATTSLTFQVWVNS